VTIASDATNPISALQLKQALSKLQSLLGSNITQNLIEKLENMGIEVSNDHEVYFLHEIREALDIIFGKEAAEILMQRIALDLNKD
jgi:hypothetical protein